MCIPTRTRLTYNNDKPWFTAKFRQLHQAKEDAYRNGNRVLYKQAKYTGKGDQSSKEELFLMNQLSSSDWKVWKR